MSKEELKQFLSTQTLEELSYIQGRYCGPHNVFLAMKKFGRTINTEVAQELMERLLLGTADSND